MFELFIAVAVLIAVGVGLVWVSEQISAYMNNENLQSEEYFEFEPLFK